MDFRILRKKLNDILDDFDHRNLNDIFDSMGKSPSSEFIARLIYERLRDSLEGSGVKVTRVEVQETPGNWAAYYE
jgi:6-pyruvoyltetrahydropterin/6-carboxytetrahydropterin synthase